MGWQGDGTFVRSNGTNSGTETWQDDAAAATAIRADRHDTHDQDLSDGIAACLTKNMETKPTADFVPNATGTYDLGTSSLKWEDLILNNDAVIGGNATITGDCVFAERSDHASTPGAGYGYHWVKDSAPTEPYYTDDAGNDHNLLGPAGVIMMWTTGTAPTGWLECDGAAVSRTTYARLFAVIADTYGVGDGSTTFNLPDLRGQFVRGWDNGAGVDPDAASRTDRGDGTTGDNVGTLQDEEFKSHNHAVNLNNASGNASIAQSGASGTDDTDNSQSSGGNETRPVNIALMYIIKV